MTENTAFSSSGADAITRTIDLAEDVSTNLPPHELEETYDVARTVAEIERGDYKRASDLVRYGKRNPDSQTIDRFAIPG